MTTVVGDFELTMDELRVVARFATESAEDVLPAYEAAVPGEGGPVRSRLDRVHVLNRPPLLLDEQQKVHQVVQ